MKPLSYKRFLKEDTESAKYKGKNRLTRMLVRVWRNWNSKTLLVGVEDIKTAFENWWYLLKLTVGLSKVISVKS